MYAHLKGRVDDTLQDTCVIDVGGVGYLVHASRLTLSQLNQGETCHLFIDTIMRQESLTLFGFYTKNEQEWFRLLLSAQGVGPKVALAIVGSLGLDTLSTAIMQQDKAMLSRADGVGPKLASRILLELKDKMKSFGADMPVLGAPEHATTSTLSDVRSALMNLGYGTGEIQRACTMIQADHGDKSLMHSGEMIRLALQYLQR